MKETSMTPLISLSEILEENTHFDKVETYTLKNGKDMQFYPYFSRTKLVEIVNEYKSYAWSKDEDDKKFMDMVQQDDMHVTLFWYFLAIKKFTHFGEYMKDVKQVKELIPYYEALLETGLLDEIVNDVFKYEELRKVSEIFIADTAATIASTEVAEKFAEDVKIAKQKFKEAIKEK